MVKKFHPCAHCEKRCALNYAFCFNCAGALPPELRAKVTRGYSSRGNNRVLDSFLNVAIKDARGYLAADDKQAFILERAKACETWATDHLTNTGAVTNEQITAWTMEWARAQASARGEKV